MVIVVILSAVLIYLLLTINKGIPPEKIPGDVDDAVIIENKFNTGKFLFSSEWNLVFKIRKSFVGRLKGNSMKARGLCRNDIIIANPVGDIKPQLKKGDLILVETSDPHNSGKSKITLREFDCELANGYISTIAYDRFCPVKTACHKTKDIIAVIDSHIKYERLTQKPLAVN